MSAVLDRETLERLRTLAPREAFRRATDAVYRAGAVSSDDFLEVYGQLVEAGILSWEEIETLDS